MPLSAALLLLAPIAASSAAAAAGGEASAASPRSVPVANATVTATVTATARIIRPASVRVRRLGDMVEIEAEASAKPQTARDGKGTLWIEFS